MKLKQLIDEDFVNYKKPSMFIGTSECDWKCCKEQCLDISICQNSQLANSKTIDVPVEDLVHRYIDNSLTEAVVFGGLEPIKQQKDILDFIYFLRENDCYDDIVIYTGYNENEIEFVIEFLKAMAKKNLFIKFGRFIPDDTPHFDDVLGIELSSNNQYCKQIC